MCQLDSRTFKCLPIPGLPGNPAARWAVERSGSLVLATKILALQASRARHSLVIFVRIGRRGSNRWMLKLPVPLAPAPGAVLGAVSSWQYRRRDGGLSLAESKQPAHRRTGCMMDTPQAA